MVRAFLDKIIAMQLDIYAMLFLGILFIFAVPGFAILIYLELHSEALIRALKSDSVLYKKSGKPSYEYFMTRYAWFWDRRMVLFIIRNKELPDSIAKDVDNYQLIRKLCIVMEILHFSLLLVVVSVLVWVQF